MNIEEMKKTDTNIVSVSDSLELPLIKLVVKVNSDTIIPNTNVLIIYVDKNETETTEKKTYTFNLKEKLQVNDEFIIEPRFNGNKILLESYKKSGETIEKVNTEKIILFEGINYISTNYENAEISIVYPKNTDLVNYFLNTSIYGLDNKNKILTLDDIYFKDCFTLEDNKINADIDSLNVSCISSKTGKFRMDEEGNLRVKAIITDEQPPVGNIDFDSIYPVGSIYMSVNNTNPSTLFGGTWEVLQDRFLIGAGNKYAVGNTGGNENHSHTLWHKHSVPGQGHSHGLSSAWAYISLYAKQVFINKRSGVPSWNDTYQMTGSSYGTSGTGSGNSTATNLGGTTDWTTPNAVDTNSQDNATTSTNTNIPPYLSVYMWKRIA